MEVLLPSFLHPSHGHLDWDLVAVMGHRRQQAATSAWVVHHRCLQ